MKGYMSIPMRVFVFDIAPFIIVETGLVINMYGYFKRDYTRNIFKIFTYISRGFDLPGEFFRCYEVKNGKKIPIGMYTSLHSDGVTRSMLLDGMKWAVFKRMPPLIRSHDKYKGIETIQMDELTDDLYCEVFPKLKKVYIKSFGQYSIILGKGQEDVKIYANGNKI